ncbi:MAG: hypothetical protein IKL84_01895, partial [Clostridia bacterium]|nr:hypothetical protein [Clostridia bacterium]
SLTAGRLLGAMTWYAALIGRPLAPLTFNPAPEEITPERMALLKASAEAAVSAPDRVTPSRRDRKAGANLEIERKWLIVRPDPVLLAAQPKANAVQIIQTYLVAGQEASSRRVRAAQKADGSVIYTQTVKHRIGSIIAEEDEREISRDEYTALLEQADPACRPIEKTRWRIPYQNHTLEIDLYPFWTEQAVLEIELPSPDTAVSLPDWLTVIREVSGDRTFSNHQLAQMLHTNGTIGK